MSDIFENDQLLSVGELEDLINLEMGELSLITNVVEQKKAMLGSSEKPKPNLKFKNKSSSKSNSHNKENMYDQIMPSPKILNKSNKNTISSSKKALALKPPGTPNKNSYLKNAQFLSSNKQNSSKKAPEKPKDLLKTPQGKNTIPLTLRNLNSLKGEDKDESFYNLDQSNFQSNNDFALGKALKFSDNTTGAKKNDNFDEDDLFSRLNNITQINPVIVDSIDDRNGQNDTYRKLKSMIDNNKENIPKKNNPKNLDKDKSQEKNNYSENLKKKYNSRENSLDESGTKFQSNIKTSKRKPLRPNLSNKKEEAPLSSRSRSKDNPALKYGSVKYIRELSKHKPKILQVNNNPKKRQQKLLEKKSKQIDIECELEVDESMQEDNNQPEYIKETFDKPIQNVSEIEIKQDSYISQKSGLSEVSYETVDPVKEMLKTEQNEDFGYQTRNTHIEDAEEFLKQKLMGFRDKEVISKNFVEKNKKNITPKKKSLTNYDSQRNYNSYNDSQITRAKSPIKWEPIAHRKKVSVEEHSFRPMLSKNSLTIAENLPNREERLYNGKDKKNKPPIDHQPMPENTFKPKINQMSKYIDKKINDDKSSRCDQLYHTKDYYNARKELLVEQKKYQEEVEMQNCTFKPKKTTNTNYNTHFSVGSDIASRNQQWQKKKEEKIVMAKQLKEHVENDHAYAPKTNKNYQTKNHVDYYSSSFMQEGLMEHFQRIEKAKKEREDKENKLQGKKRNNNLNPNNNDHTPSKITVQNRNSHSQRNSNHSNMHGNNQVTEQDVETIRRLHYEFNNT